jgi:hypothetical protein
MRRWTCTQKAQHALVSIWWRRCACDEAPMRAEKSTCACGQRDDDAMRRESRLEIYAAK